MGEVAKSTAGLLPKISSLFNNHKLSDVVFVFMKDTEVTEKLYGHKLILALRSEVFTCMFFDNKKSPSEVKLPASKKSCYFHLLKFLYTDEVQLHSPEEAQELYELASEYDVVELTKKCSDYIFHESVTIENIIPKYECALQKNLSILLEKCQDFVCSNTQLVLESVYFVNAPVYVVQDIIQQNNLSVSTELDVIRAVLKWGSKELKRTKGSLDEKYLRECIEPFMKHLRFLTLSHSEFDFFVKNFNIFNVYEASVLTRKIYLPDYEAEFPKSLCSISYKRGKSQGLKNMPVGATVNNLSHNSSFKNSSNLPFSVPDLTSDSLSKGMPSMSSSNSMFQNFSSKKISEISSKPTSHTSFSKPVISSPPQSPSPSTNKISYQVKNFSPFRNSNVPKSQMKETKFCSSPNIQNIGSFSPSTERDSRRDFPRGIKLDSNRLRDFEFHLVESRPCFSISFQKDLKSTVNFKMITGNIRLYGFELKVKNNKSRSSEELDIDVDLKGFSKQPFCRLYKKMLKDNTLSVKFPDKMVLCESVKGTLEVSIDNLLLNRCCICSNDKGLKLNNGLNFACEISVSSNQQTDDGSLFLISKLIYVPC